MGQDSGKGLSAAQIQGVLHEGKDVTEVTGGRFKEEVYILLKDGTIYDGLPCAPDQLDVAASRRNQPESWGQWKQSGKDILARWQEGAGRYGGWSKVGTAPFVLPAAKGQRLSGRYETGQAYSFGGVSSSVFFQGVTFTPEGRFTTDRSAMHGTNNPGVDATNVHAYGDDEGSSVTVTGPGIGGGTTSKRKPKKARTGTYSLDGYVLTLRYDDGRAVRQPFFFWNEKKDAIWFRDSTYSKEKKDAKN